MTYQVFIQTFDIPKTVSLSSSICAGSILLTRLIHPTHHEDKVHTDLTDLQLLLKALTGFVSWRYFDEPSASLSAFSFSPCSIRLVLRAPKWLNVCTTSRANTAVCARTCTTHWPQIYPTNHVLRPVVARRWRSAAEGACMWEISVTETALSGTDMFSRRQTQINWPEPRPESWCSNKCMRSRPRTWWQTWTWHFWSGTQSPPSVCNLHAPRDERAPCKKNHAISATYNHPDTTDWPTKCFASILAKDATQKLTRRSSDTHTSVHDRQSTTVHSTRQTWPTRCHYCSHSHARTVPQGRSPKTPRPPPQIPRKGNRPPQLWRARRGASSLCTTGGDSWRWTRVGRRRENGHIRANTRTHGHARGSGSKYWRWREWKLQIYFRAATSASCWRQTREYEPLPNPHDFALTTRVYFEDNTRTKSFITTAITHLK